MRVIDLRVGGAYRDVWRAAWEHGMIAGDNRLEEVLASMRATTD